MLPVVFSPVVLAVCAPFIAGLFALVSLLHLRDGLVSTLRTGQNCLWMRVLGPRLSMKVVYKLFQFRKKISSKEALKEGNWNMAICKAQLLEKNASSEEYGPEGTEISAEAVSDVLSGHVGRKGSVLFAGSSTFTYWLRIAADVSPFPVVNSAFGGSTTVDVNEHFQSLVARWDPRVIVYFCAANDYANGMGESAPYDGFRRFLELVKEHCSSCVGIIYCNCNIQPFMLSEWSAERLEWSRNLNARFKSAFSNRKSDLYKAIEGTTKCKQNIELVYADIDAEPWTKELWPYVNDGMHFNPAGHGKFAEFLRPSISRLWRLAFNASERGITT